MISLNSVMEMFNKTDMSRVSDELTPMQKEINREHNARTIGSGSCSERIISLHDDVMGQAVSRRQL